MAKNKKESEFFKVYQTCLTGSVLRLFKYDLEINERKPSTAIREIIKEHYTRCPPLGYYNNKSKD